MCPRFVHHRLSTVCPTIVCPPFVHCSSTFVHFSSTSRSSVGPLFVHSLCRPPSVKSFQMFACSSSNVRPHTSNALLHFGKPSTKPYFKSLSLGFAWKSWILHSQYLKPWDPITQTLNYHVQTLPIVNCQIQELKVHVPKPNETIDHHRP